MNFMVLVAAEASASGSSSLRLLLGLAILVTLALVGSSRRFWSLRRTAIGAALTTGGWVAVGVGLLLGPHGPIPGGLITADQMRVLRPLVLFCLGWVGFMIGMQAHSSILRMLPGAVLRMAGFDALLSTIVITVAALGVMSQAMPDATVAQQVILALLLGMCGVGWSAEARSLRYDAPAGHPAGVVLRSGSGLGSIFALIGYGVVFKLMLHQMPEPAADHTAATLTLSVGSMAAGLAVSVLIALAMGLLSLWLMRAAGRSDSEFLVVLLGTVAFVAGGAAVLGYSPLFVSMLCGFVVVNLPGSVLDRFQQVIINAEQPMAMALMLAAGVMLDPRLTWGDAALLGAVLAARLVVKLLWSAGRVRAYVTETDLNTLLPLGVLRQSPLAVALAVGFALSPHEPLFHGVMTGGRLIGIVALAGLLADTAPLLTRLALPKRESTT